MAIPALLGLPWLASAIGGFFASAAGWYTATTIKKIALITAALAVIISITGGFSLAIKALLDAVVYPVPQISAIYLILPSNFPAVTGAFISLRLLRWAYDWNIKVIKLTLRS